MCSIKKVGAFLLTIFLTCETAFAVTFNYFEGDFNNPPTNAQLVGGNPSSSSMMSVQNGVGGNPGNYVKVMNWINPTPNGQYGNLFSVNLLFSKFYDPKVNGGVDFIDFVIDAKNFHVKEQPQSTGLVILQNGHVFWANRDTLITTDTDWSIKSSFGLKSSDFKYLSSLTLDLALVNLSLNGPTPIIDFSNKGGLMTFGFFSANSGFGTYDTVVGYDNFRVAVTTPEPLSSSLLASGLFGFLLKRRKEN